MSKCLGGYQLIDLKGIVLSGVEQNIDPEPWKYARELRKPVIISNFIDEAYGVRGPVTLTCSDGRGVFVGVFSALGFPSVLAISVSLVSLDSDNQVTIKEEELEQ